LERPRLTGPKPWAGPGLRVFILDSPGPEPQGEAWAAVGAPHPKPWAGPRLIIFILDFQGPEKSKINTLNIGPAQGLGCLVWGVPEAAQASPRGSAVVESLPVWGWSWFWPAIVLELVCRAVCRSRPRTRIPKNTARTRNKPEQTDTAFDQCTQTRPCRRGSIPARSVYISGLAAASPKRIRLPPFRSRRRRLRRGQPYSKLGWFPEYGPGFSRKLKRTMSGRIRGSAYPGTSGARPSRRGPEFPACKVRLHFRLGRRKSEPYTAALPPPQSPQGGYGRSNRIRDSGGSPNTVWNSGDQACN
jgi:hypothetical protein